MTISTDNTPRRTSAREILLNLALLLATILVVGGVLEAALRIRFARSLDFSMEMWKYAVKLKHPVPDPHLSFAHVPNSSAFLMGYPVSINSHGLRDQEYTVEKPAGVYRILMLGDSTTFGWGVPEEQTVAKILEGRLRQTQSQSSRKFEVLNAGVGNYGTVQEYTHYLTYDRAFHPDLVILGYFINDAEPVPVERTPGLIGKSYLLAFAVSRFDGMLRLTGTRPNWKDYYSQLYADDKPGLHAAQAALVGLATATRADGAQLLVTILPELHEINNGYPFEKEQQKIKNVLTANQVPVIDLLDGLRGHGAESSLWVTPADDHPNGKANSLIVDQVLPWVLQHAPLAASN
ncbi:MAG: SGNH/GDSL hydrolase family protein [Acidobacteriota bacterium]|nr:SGNH/GDSL hydrolase family protein [Acidobacteriota bacterium]